MYEAINGVKKAIKEQEEIEEECELCPDRDLFIVLTNGYWSLEKSAHTWTGQKAAGHLLGR